MHDGPGAGRGGVDLIRARGEIQQLRYGERQEVGEQRRGLRRRLTSGVLLERVSRGPASDRDHGTAAGNARKQGLFASLLLPKVSYY